MGILPMFGARAGSPCDDIAKAPKWEPFCMFSLRHERDAHGTA